jgi:uncharacterized protein
MPVLSKEETEAFLASIEQVRAASAHKLQNTRDATQAVGFVQNMHRSIDLAAARTSARGPALACKAGCAFCCSVRVEATEPEVFLIARALREWSAPHRDAVIDRLRTQVANNSRQPDGTRQECAFLEDRQCSIYAVRPGVCRKGHSLSVAHCESRAAEIPQVVSLLAEAEALMTGVAQAYRQADLPISQLELQAAVLAALDDEAAEQAWYGRRATP